MKKHSLRRVLFYWGGKAAPGSEGSKGAKGSEGKVAPFGRGI